METTDTAGQAPAVRSDTELLDWLLPFLDDSDIEHSIDREARLQGALRTGLKGRDALNAAMDAVLLDRDTPEAIQAARDRAKQQDIQAIKGYLLGTHRDLNEAVLDFHIRGPALAELLIDAGIKDCPHCGRWYVRPYCPACRYEELAS